MKKFRYYFTLLILLSLIFNNSYAQNFEVPNSILEKLNLKEFEYTQTTNFSYKVVFPENYDKSKKYPVLLGLSGGNASEKIVNYCFYTLFNSKYLNNHIIILPIGPSGRTLADLNAREVKLLISKINEKENVISNNWIIAGSSMGGLAAYNFAKVKPELFQGIITFPGGLQTDDVPLEWKNYKIVLATGEQDEMNWKNLSKLTKIKLKNKVQNIKMFNIKGQGHIISPEYDIDNIYKLYFE